MIGKEKKKNEDVKIIQIDKRGNFIKVILEIKDKGLYEGILLKKHENH